MTVGVDPNDIYHNGVWYSRTGAVSGTRNRSTVVGANAYAFGDSISTYTQAHGSSSIIPDTIMVNIIRIDAYCHNYLSSNIDFFLLGGNSAKAFLTVWSRALSCASSLYFICLADSDLSLAIPSHSRVFVRLKSSRRSAREVIHLPEAGDSYDGISAKPAGAVNIRLSVRLPQQ